MNESNGIASRWGWGIGAPIALIGIAILWMLDGEVSLASRGAETTYTGWGLWACAAVPFFFGLRLHAEHFLSEVTDAAPWTGWMSLVSGWLAGAGLLGCLLWVGLGLGR